MRFRNLYVKLFIAILFILIALQVYFFIDLNYSAKKRLSPERDQNRVVRILMLKKLVEENIRRNNGFSKAGGELEKIVSEAAILYEAKIWVEDSQGSLVLASFPSEERPEKLSTDVYRSTKRDGVDISQFYRNNIKMFFTETPLDLDASDGLSLHVFYESERTKYLSKFTIGLAEIILIMAVIALSLLQFIRVKVNRLRGSVLRIADGDLDHRVAVDGRGVVEELGRAFNAMTDKLEKMITSSKEITANVSHEIRTPLARMRVFEDLLRKKCHRGEYADCERHLDNIRDDIQVLDDLVGRLLEFIKLDNYETIHKIEKIDPSELLGDLLLRFEPVVEYKQLHVRKDIETSSPVSGDRSALTSAFLNVLDNAVKYTPENGVIGIATTSDQDFFHARVVNSFEKMDQQELDNIFKPFERVRRSEAAGSGLGLAITKKIVEKHGGAIVALNSDEGFEIRIRLPLE
jgi:two-component system sensor histidine kinase CpxA